MMEWVRFGRNSDVIEGNLVHGAPPGRVNTIAVDDLEGVGNQHASVHPQVMSMAERNQAGGRSKKHWLRGCGGRRFEADGIRLGAAATAPRVLRLRVRRFLLRILRVLLSPHAPGSSRSFCVLARVL